jgi:hypothetical protein
MLAAGIAPGAAQTTTAPSAPSREAGAPELTEQQRQAFRSAKTVRILLDQDMSITMTRSEGSENVLFNGMTKPEFDEAFRAYQDWRASRSFDTLAEHILSYAGLSPVSGRGRAADLTVRISATVSPDDKFRGAPKGGGGLNLCATLVTLSGTIALSASNVPEYAVNFSGRVLDTNCHPAQSVATSLPESLRGPGGFLDTLMRTVDKVYGAGPVVAMRLKDADKKVCRQALAFLEESRPPGAVGPLIAALHDKNFPVLDLTWNPYGPARSSSRKVAAELLAKLGDPSAVDPLIAALKDEDAGVRKTAAESLATFQDPRTVDPFIAALKDEDAGVRGTAANSLGHLHDPRAVEPLIAALKDREVNVRFVAAKSLAALTGQNLGQDSKLWQDWWGQNKNQLPVKP